MVRSRLLFPFALLVVVFALIVLANVRVSSPPVEPTPTPTLTPQPPTPTPIPDRASTFKLPCGLSVLPSDYQERDMGNGWKVGVVRLYFENTSDSPLGLIGCNLSIEDIVVKATPSKSYPAALIKSIGPEPRWELYLKDQIYEAPRSDLFSAPSWWFSFDDPVFAPSRFPFSLLENRSSGTQFVYEIGFRFATAAKPEQIVLTTKNDGIMTLGLQNKASAPMPKPDITVLQTAPVEQLIGDKMYDGAKLAVTLDGCEFERVDDTVQLVMLNYTLSNKDNLDQLSVKTWLHFMLYSPDFEFVSATDFLDGKINPGQSGKSMTYRNLPNPVNPAALYLLYEISDNNEPNGVSRSTTWYTLATCTTIER